VSEQQDENSIRLIRSTNSLDRELTHKIMFWYLDRLELGKSLFGAVLALPLFFINPLLFALGIPVGIFIGVTVITKWKYNRPPSYMWDSFHKWGCVGERSRFLRVVKKETILIPDLVPAKSKYADTRDGGLAMTEPGQRFHGHGMPNWADVDERGEPCRMILAYEKHIGRRVIPEWEEGESPAPIYWRRCDPHHWESDRDMVDPKISYRIVKKPYHYDRQG